MYLQLPYTMTLSDFNDLNNARAEEKLLKGLKNDPETELRIAMEEQMKITLIRLRKILS